MRIKRKFKRLVRGAFGAVTTVTLALVTPFLEKNQSKINTCRIFPWVPVMLSMTRVIVCLFACALLHQVRRFGVAGWPEATLCIAIVLALPLVNALEGARPKDVLRFGERLLRRFGEGAVRQVGGLAVTEPSKYDDHRQDDDATGPYLPARP